MKIRTNQKVARYIAAPMIGIGVLGGAALGLSGVAGAATGDPGTSQTSSVSSDVISMVRDNAVAPRPAALGGAAA